MALFNILVDIAAKTANFEAGMRRVEERLDAFGSAAKRIGGALVAFASAEGIGAAIESSLKFGSEIEHAAQKAGVSTSAIQELAYAAKQSGVELGALETGLKKMEVAISKAASGNKEANIALSALGLNIKTLRSLSPDQQFERLADGIRNLKDPTDRARAAVEFFGKAGTDLLPILEKGKTAIDAMRDAAKQMGLVISEKDIKRLDEADKAVEKMEGAWKSLERTIVADVAPALGHFFDRFRIEILGAGTEVETLQARLNYLNMTLRSRTGGAGNNPAVQAEAAALQKRVATMERLAELQKINAENAKEAAAAPGYEKATESAKKYAETLSEVSISGNYLAGSLQNLTPYLAQARETTLHNIEAIRKFKEEERDAAAVEREHQRIMAEGTAVIDATRTSSEKYAATIEHLNKLLAAHAIDFDTYQRAVKEAGDKLDTTANTIKDAFHQAFDDILRNGKIKFDQLVKDIIIRLTEKSLFNAIDGLIDAFSAGRGGGGGGGLLGPILAGFGAGFLGFAGGGRPPAGRASIVGERGPELWVPDSAGTIVPNGASAGGGDVYLTLNQTFAPGVSRAELEPFGREISKQTVAAMTNLIKRGAFARG